MFVSKTKSLALSSTSYQLNKTIHLKGKQKILKKKKTLLIEDYHNMVFSDFKLHKKSNKITKSNHKKSEKTKTWPKVFKETMQR